jgi:hypothetical protein
MIVSIMTTPAISALGIAIVIAILMIAPIMNMIMMNK